MAMRESVSELSPEGNLRSIQTKAPREVRPAPHQGREGTNAPTRDAITNAAMTAIVATENATTLQISHGSGV
jgi:hypothetical protein